jgi:hypothetical protein
MPKINWSVLIGTAVVILTIFVLGMIKTNARSSGFATACIVLGYLNDAVLLRSVISLARGQGLGKLATLAIPTIAFGDAVIIYCGYGLVLAMVTAGAVLIDGVVLRFRG